MKRIVKLMAAFILFALLSAACNQYICPAYTQEKANNESVAEPS